MVGDFFFGFLVLSWWLKGPALIVALAFGSFISWLVYRVGLASDLVCILLGVLLCLTAYFIIIVSFVGRLPED